MSAKHLKLFSFLFILGFTITISITIPKTIFAEEAFDSFSSIKQRTDGIIDKIKELTNENKNYNQELWRLYGDVNRTLDEEKEAPMLVRIKELEEIIPQKESEVKAYEARYTNNLKRLMTFDNLTEEQIQEIKDLGKRYNEEIQFPEKNSAIQKCWDGGFTIHWGACVLNIVITLVSFIIYVFGSILWLAGNIFDFSIWLSITKANWFFSLGAINMAWQLVRDLANIFFIFVLLYIAIGTIFDLSGIGSPQKMVVNVIIVALLVNFSGFFVRVVVDASNVVAYEFYLVASGEEDTTMKKIGNLGSNLVKKVAPGTYLARADSDIGEAMTKIQSTSLLGTLVQGLFSILIILVTSFVFVVASVLFVIRTVTLIFIYIISPFAFMSQIVPNNRFNYFKTWSDALIKQSLYAPGFLIPLAIVYNLLGEQGLAGMEWSTVTTLGEAVWGGVFQLIAANVIILGLIISCIFIAQKFGAVGLGVATAMGARFTQGSSQIMGRYGGRVAGNISKRIKPSQEWWEGGRVRRLARRSWDTGVLRGMRDSKAGQVVGQGVKNPLFSAGAGIGFMANQMGVKGMDNITGDKIFSKDVEERAGKYLEEMRKLETDNDRVRYLESLAGQGKREEFDAVYAKLSPEERRKLEQTSRRRGDAGNPRSQFLAQKLETSRKGLKLKAGQDTAIEMVKDLKLETNDDNQRVALIEHLSQDDLNAVYKGLSREEKVALERSATGNQALTARLGIARDKLKAGDKRAVERGMTSENAYIELKSKLESGQQISEQDVTNLSKDRLLELSEPELTRVDIARHLTIGQLKAIRDSEIPSTTKRAIRETIQAEINRNRATNQTPIPDHLTKLEQYFNSAGAGFGD